MEFSDEPIAYFITWTVYGTFLQGDARWWRKRKQNQMPPQPPLKRWHRDRLNHDIILLSDAKRRLVEEAITSICEYRKWNLWRVNARSNHVHVVVTAPGYDGDRVIDQLKARCTRVLRESYSDLCDRPVWTKLGDVEFIYTQEDLDRVIEYVGDAQDRMGFGM